MPLLRPAVNDSDNFLTKIVKYIPAEIITAYTAALGVWSTDPPPEGSQKTYTFVLLFILVVTPIWTYFAVLDNKNNTEPPSRKKRAYFHAVVALISFVIWLYALGDKMFKEYLLNHNIPYHQYLGSIILILYTGLFVPLLERIFLGPLSKPKPALYSVRQDIVDHLVDNGDNSFNSYLKENVYGIERRCDLYFSASSWEGARSIGKTFLDVLNNTRDVTFECLHWLTMELDDFDPTGDHNIFITYLEFSGLWRPQDPYPPHVDGRAMDIVIMRLSIGEEIVFNNVDGMNAEPGAAKVIRNAAFPRKATQYLSPWWIRSINLDGTTTDRANDRTSAIDKAHLNHLHLTIPKA